MLNSPLEIFGHLGFVLCRQRSRLGLTSRAMTLRTCGHPLSLSSLSKHPLPGASSPDRLGDRGALGEPVSWAWKERAEPCPSGVKRVHSAFILAAEGQPNTTTLSRCPPPRAPSRRGSTGPRQAGAAAAFPCRHCSTAHTLSRSAPQESEPGQGTRKSLQIRPRQGLSASAPPLRGDQVVAGCGSGPQGPVG